MEKRKTILRAEKTREYSVICNQCFRDPSLSARAKGVFAYVMTLPDDWEIYKNELYGHFSEGRDAINKAIRELELAGYISKRPRQVSGGKLMGWEYTVREKPLDIPEKPSSTVSLKTRVTVSPLGGESVPIKYLSSENTERRNVEKPSTVQRSTGLKSNKKGRLSVAGAPWVGRSYNGVKLPQIRSYEDLSSIPDPVLAAMAVTGETGVMGFGHWVSVLNSACESGMPVDMAVRVFGSCVSKVYGESKAGELKNTGAALNKELERAFR